LQVSPTAVKYHLPISLTTIHCWSTLIFLYLSQLYELCNAKT
jgi:hypothetical protein